MFGHPGLGGRGFKVEAAKLHISFFRRRLKEVERYGKQIWYQRYIFCETLREFQCFGWNILSMTIQMKHRVVWYLIRKGFYVLHYGLVKVSKFQMIPASFPVLIFNF